MFQKLVAIEPVGLFPAYEKRLYEFAKEVCLYPDRPEDDEEIIRRIGDADAVLVSYTTSIDRYVIERCPSIRYIGMCCSLYSPESANVDILAANERGITVTGIRDYGDAGVLEYVISELVRFLHGFGCRPWKGIPLEITGLKAGIIGLGTTGILIADGLSFFGAEVSYYSRTRKPEQEAKGFQYQPLHQLLADCDVIFTCLNKNVILLHEEEFHILGDNKLLFNTSIGPSHDVDALAEWLKCEGNHFFCDTEAALGDESKVLLLHPRVHCMRQSAGSSRQCKERLGQKVTDNIERYLKETDSDFSKMQ